MNDLQVKSTKKVLTLDSREVAEMVEKRHANLIRDIRTYINYLTDSKMSSLDFFIPNTYIDGKGEERRNYKITKKGCEFIAHKLTGQKGAQFTATYINRFHEMEQTLKQSVFGNLSPELQVLINLELEQKKLKEEITKTKQVADKTHQTVQSIKDTIIQTDEDWRNWVNNQMSKMSFKNKDYREKRAESYKFLEERARCRLKVRLKNLKERLQQSGASKTEINKTNYLDVIESDTRLKEIYTMIVKEMAIKYVA